MAAAGVSHTLSLRIGSLAGLLVSLCAVGCLNDNPRDRNRDAFAYRAVILRSTLAEPDTIMVRRDEDAEIPVPAYNGYSLKGMSAAGDSVLLQQGSLLVRSGREDVSIELDYVETAEWLRLDTIAGIATREAFESARYDFSGQVQAGNSSIKLRPIPTDSRQKGISCNDMPVDASGECTIAVAVGIGEVRIVTRTPDARDSMVYRLSIFREGWETLAFADLITADTLSVSMATHGNAIYWAYVAGGQAKIVRYIPGKGAEPLAFPALPERRLARGRLALETGGQSLYCAVQAGTEVYTSVFQNGIWNWLDEPIQAPGIQDFHFQVFAGYPYFYIASGGKGNVYAYHQLATSNTWTWKRSSAYVEEDENHIDFPGARMGYDGTKVFIASQKVSESDRINTYARKSDTIWTRAYGIMHHNVGSWTIPSLGLAFTMLDGAGYFAFVIETGKVWALKGASQKLSPPGSITGEFEYSPLLNKFPEKGISIGYLSTPTWRTGDVTLQLKSLQGDGWIPLSPAPVTEGSIPAFDFEFLGGSPYVIYTTKSGSAYRVYVKRYFFAP